jgi:hypothetical protein
MAHVCGPNSSGVWQGTVADCEHDNGPSGSIKGGKFLDQKGSCWLRNKVSPLQM